MSEQSWTPEPWERIHVSGSDDEIYAEMPKERKWFSGRTLRCIAKVKEDQPNWVLNRDRIIACVNACAGIPNPEGLAKTLEMAKEFVIAARISESYEVGEVDDMADALRAIGVPALRWGQTDLSLCPEKRMDPVSDLREIGITFPDARPAGSRKHMRRLMAYHRIYQRMPWWRRWFMEAPLPLPGIVYYKDHYIIMPNGERIGPVFDARTENEKYSPRAAQAERIDRMIENHPGGGEIHIDHTPSPFWNNHSLR